MSAERLSREITAWQTSFARERGREPTRADVEGDPAVREVFRRYKAIRDAGHRYQFQFYDYKSLVFLKSVQWNGRE